MSTIFQQISMFFKISEFPKGIDKHAFCTVQEKAEQAKNSAKQTAQEVESSAKATAENVKQSTEKMSESVSGATDNIGSDTKE